MIIILAQLYDTFKHWSEKGSVWIYSDPHFEDKDCLVINPKWVMPEEQIKRINSKVQKNDTIIILGDIGNIDCIRKIKGYKVLIAGNHDKGLSNYKRKVVREEFDKDKKTLSELEEKFRPFEKDGYKVLIDDSLFEKYVVYLDNKLFNEVYGGPLFISDKIILSHEPIYLPFALNIHGHSHNSNFYTYNKDDIVTNINVASDVINWTPINLKDIIKQGHLKSIDSIHRLAINKQIEKKINI